LRRSIDREMADERATKALAQVRRLSYIPANQHPRALVMKMRGFSGIGFVLLTCGGMALMPQGAHAQIDAAFIPRAAPERHATQSDVPDYDSNYAAASRLSDSGDSTPEADARPGEYYFRLGAHAFRTKNYTFAIQMYQVSASWAYKPAEYNIAVMYARGQGVPVDLPRAMAWIALAAERNEKHYIEAREAVFAEISKEQFDQANAIWRELKPTYGDEVALRRAKARWAQVRANMTGSRVGSAAVPLDVGMPAVGQAGRSQVPNMTHANYSKSALKTGPSGIVGTSSGELLSGRGVDGDIAYRQFRESDNPYDPKFDRTAFGTTLVGPPSEVKAGENKETKTDAPESTKHDQ
jgi:hypothetical protein